jgi:Domain of unknown function (DUF4399)
MGRFPGVGAATVRNAAAQRDAACSSSRPSVAKRTPHRRGAARIARQPNKKKACQMSRMPRLSDLPCVALVGAALLGPAAAWAQAPADAALQRRCWQSFTLERTAFNLRDPVSVSFGNLKNGYTVRSPVWVEFGIRGMGVVPAGTAHDKAGHHHILVDRALPMNHRDKIPFDDSHRHFGKGQTAAALDLPPGKHTLRLLFADHEHRPHFVFSPEITINVVAKRDAANAPRIDERNFEASCASWYQDVRTTPRSAAKEVYAKNVRDGDQVLSPMVLSLGAVGFGIAPQDKPLKDTGHFALTVLQGGKLVARHVWSDGRTESALDLPRGEVDLQLALLDADGKTLLQGEPLRLTVMSRNSL